ncbi:TPT-domain-containing protein [Auriscalpium vulgare]|uniref:TPT-domain-containing protein n=1 Tax=Auriscalpium vulgare TaxID=40419 RepID=A0ACB8S2I6_9AGAM|nr:TPT-domain-containing protein [Auriscalpium vulgare]
MTSTVQTFFDDSEAEGLPLPTVSPSSSSSDLASHFPRSLSSSTARRHSFNQLLLASGLHKLKRYSDRQSFWLALYFTFNLLLTLYNKLILVSFPFPYILTALHALCGSLGGQLLLRHGVYQPKKLHATDYMVLAAFSVLYSVNIAISNVSLDLVTVPFHQVVRAATPIFTTFLSWWLFNAHFSHHKIASLMPVIAGVGLATYGDYYFTTWGFVLTLLGTFLAALKTIVTHLLQTTPARRAPPSLSRRRIIRIPTPFLSVSIAIPQLIIFRPSSLNLHPLDLLTRMSPLAFAQCLLYATMAGEVDSLRSGHERADAYMYFRHPFLYAVLLAGNGIIAFGLNVVSFEANRRAGALSMGVAANVKQVLTIICAVSLFNLQLSTANVAGVALTLGGGAWYAFVEYREKMSKPSRSPRAM